MGVEEKAVGLDAAERAADLRADTRYLLALSRRSTVPALLDGQLYAELSATARDRPGVAAAVGAQ